MIEERGGTRKTDLGFMIKGRDKKYRPWVCD